MIPYRQALAILLQEARRDGVLHAQTVPADRAAGRVLAAKVLAPEPLPSFDNSSMDGFALKAADTRSASRKKPARLEVLGALAAGDAPRGPAGAQGAVEVTTGAPVPKGLDAVVKVEDVRVVEEDGRRFVELSSPAESGLHVRRRGKDIAAGTAVADPGTLLQARHLLALAALGVPEVKVRRRPQVAVLSTGRELAGSGETPGPGRIRNSTAAYLACALQAAGAEAYFFGDCPDDPHDFDRRLAAALGGRPDVVVTTGAVSMGPHDFVTREVERLGAETLFHKAAIRPGRPLLAARLREGPLLLGLPGNPVSTVVGLRFFLLPYLRRRLGLPEETPFKMALEEDVPKPEGLRCFFKAASSVSPSGASVRCLPGQASFQIRPLLEADSWAVLPEKGDRARAGTAVEVWPL